MNMSAILVQRNLLEASMKDFFKGLVMITAALLIFPAVPYIVGAISPQPEEAVEASADITVPRYEPYDIISEVKIYDTVGERSITVTTEEYLAASLAAQLSPDADPEVLKAQAVLMYTYILRRRLEEADSPTPELHGCDISNDASKYPRLALGDDLSYDLEPYRKVSQDVLGEYCAYNGDPISVAYCYSAGTTTESAETVLGVEVPYLKATPTSEADGYLTTVTYTSEEVFARLTTTPDGYVLLGDASDWITEKETMPSGYVKSVYLDSRFVVSGTEIAQLLNLPSARFTYRYSPATDRFTFTVSGSGSLVGLSQRGASALAEDGYNYKEILLHYFSGIDIVKSKAPSTE